MNHDTQDGEPRSPGYPTDLRKTLAWAWGSWLVLFMLEDGANRLFGWSIDFVAGLFWTLLAITGWGLGLSISLAMGQIRREKWGGDLLRGLRIGASRESDLYAWTLAWSAVVVVILGATQDPPFLDRAGSLLMMSFFIDGMQTGGFRDLKLLGGALCRMFVVNMALVPLAFAWPFARIALRDSPTRWGPWLAGGTALFVGVTLLVWAADLQARAVESRDATNPPGT